MLHIVCPGLFVMWDVQIREHCVGYNNACGYEFAFKYLPQMKKEIAFAIETHRKKHGGSASEASRSISAPCDGRILGKLADEYNYLKCAA